MKDPGLNTLVLVLIVITFVLLSSIIVIDRFETEEKPGGNEITGAMQSFEVYHKTIGPHCKHVKTSKRYDDKHFEYLEHIQEQRDKTFMRGRVFLRK